MTPGCLLATVCSPRGLRLQVFRGLKSKHWPAAPTGGLVPSPFDSGLTLAEETCLHHNCQVTEGVRARTEPLPHLNPGKAGGLGQKRLGSFSDSQAWRDRPGNIQPQLGGQLEALRGPTSCPLTHFPITTSVVSMVTQWGQPPQGERAWTTALPSCGHQAPLSMWGSTPPASALPRRAPAQMRIAERSGPRRSNAPDLEKTQLASKIEEAVF